MKTDTCYDKLTSTVDGAIEVAGIMTFINLDSLTPNGDKLAELIGGFQGNVEDNIKSSALVIWIPPLKASRKYWKA